MKSILFPLAHHLPVEKCPRRYRRNEHGCDLTSDSSASYMGADITADLHGEQEGDYRLDIKTGMLKSGKIRSNLRNRNLFRAFPGNFISPGR